MAKRKRARAKGAGEADPDQDVQEKLAAIDSWLDEPLTGQYRDVVEAMLLAQKHGKYEEPAPAETLE